MAKKTFYITTPIYYPNDIPHLGHAYTTIAADVLARWNKLLGKDVFFLTGTDEHGKKLQRTAEAAGKSPKEFLDNIIPEFKSAWEKLNIQYDRFIRTTDKDHEGIVKEVIEKCYKKGDIYKGFYEGLYCTSCEAYYTEKDAPDKHCPIHKKPLELLKEESYFFKLSNYQKKLLDLYKKNPEFISPKSRAQEVINRVKEGLQDFSVSRTSFDWGIQLPFDKKHIAYVWFDALLNYYSATREKGKEKFWPANVHIIGKDILWFHAVYWPAMLLSAKIDLPEKIFAHGWWTVHNEKMGKSAGNAIKINQLISYAGVDSARYFLLREVPFGDDGDFSERALIERHNNELANKLGNLVSRVSTLAEKYGIEKAKPIDSKRTVKAVTAHLENLEFDKALNEIFAFIDKCNEYIQEKKPWEVRSPQGVDEGRGSSSKSESNSRKVLYQLANAIKEFTILLSPFIPETAEKIANTFSFEISLKALKEPIKVSKIQKSEILFKKIDIDPSGNELDRLNNLFSNKSNININNKKDLAKMFLNLTSETKGNDRIIQENCYIIAGFGKYQFGDELDSIISEAGELELPKNHVQGDVYKRFSDLKRKIQNYISSLDNINNKLNKSPSTEGIINMSDIKYDDFAKLDLRVARIKRVEDIEGADKLYKLTIDVGELGERTICAGIKQHYSKEQLTNKSIIIIANLEPRKLKGIESRGMLLAASNPDHTKVILLSPEQEIEPGSKVG